MDTFSEVFKAIASYPWQVNVGVLSLIPLYIIDFKFFDKLNIGLQRKIALAKERGHVARGMIMKEDAKRLVVNNSQSAYSYWAARYTYTVDGKEYRKRFSCDNRHSTRSKLRTIINVYWLDDPTSLSGTIAAIHSAHGLEFLRCCFHGLGLYLSYCC